MLQILPEAGSTNDELVARATGPDAASWPDFSVLVTDNQTQGRGRLGRSWTAPPGDSLAISLLLRPVTAAGGRLPLQRFGWFPLMAGLAMKRAVAAEFARAGTPSGRTAPVTLKWPNDVLVDGRKISGILSELLPEASGVVIGAGVNLTLGLDDRPVDTATSFLLEGVPEPAADELLAGYLRELRSLYERFVATDGSPSHSGVLQEVNDNCDTVGQQVRVELPSGAVVTGRAELIDQEGRIVIEPGGNAALVAVAAGDVTHLRVLMRDDQHDGRDD